MHPLSDDGAGASNLIAGKFKLAQNYSPFKESLVL